MVQVLIGDISQIMVMVERVAVEEEHPVIATVPEMVVLLVQADVVLLQLNRHLHMVAMETEGAVELASIILVVVEEQVDVVVKERPVVLLLVEMV
jgi:hypothetical protein